MQHMLDFLCTYALRSFVCSTLLFHYILFIVYFVIFVVVVVVVFPTSFCQCAICRWICCKNSRLCCRCIYGKDKHANIYKLTYAVVRKFICSYMLIYIQLHRYAYTVTYTSTLKYKCVYNKATVRFRSPIYLPEKLKAKRIF